MFRPESSDSDDGDGDTPEQELLGLRTQLRQTRKARRNYKEEMENEIERQRKILAQLERESIEMEKDLALAASRKIESEDRDAVDEMVQLQQRDETMRENVRAEEEREKQLTKELKELEKKAREQHKAMGGIHKAQEKHVALKKQTRVMENRLLLVKQEYNSMLKKNELLRKTIDHFKEERNTFEKVQGRLKMQLQHIQDGLSATAAVTAKTFEARDEAQAKIKTMKDKSEKEMQHFNQELRELMRSLDNTEGLKEFMALKEQERIVSISGARRKEVSDPEVDAAAKFEAAIQHMKEATGIDDMDQLVARFMQVEDENFTLFNYINTHGALKEDLARSIEKVQAEMEEFRDRGVALDGERKRILSILEKELAVHVERRNFNKGRISLYRSTLDELKSGVNSMFNKVGCDPSAINDMLGGQQGVTDASVLQYIGIIEERASELLQLQSFVLTKEADEAIEIAREAAERQEEDVEKAIAAVKATLPVTLLMNSIPAAPRVSHEVIAPSTMDEPSLISDGSDHDEPFDMDELRERAKRELSKKEAKKNATEPTQEVELAEGGTQRLGSNTTTSRK
ncbi:uncharacterized protein LOC135821619 [Sycon ciliatum]|uniref:uncharacterized protein LOC135821619 n=1 Tax=Sycon ciliatum TaxID=27933 RepID=UPI0020AC729A|eukprot:scpid47545/ scgid14235/ Coiled-coil domain-containing protein 63